jgi:hypothetical protein
MKDSEIRKLKNISKSEKVEIGNGNRNQMESSSRSVVCCVPVHPASSVLCAVFSPQLELVRHLKFETPHFDGEGDIPYVTLKFILQSLSAKHQLKFFIS